MLRDDEPIRLSRDDWDHFAALLEEETPPGSPVSTAMARFAQGSFEGGRYHG